MYGFVDVFIRKVKVDCGLLNKTLKNTMNFTDGDFVGIYLIILRRKEEHTTENTSVTYLDSVANLITIITITNNT